MHILVIRFSSLGDVALTIPVFRTLEQELPEQQFYFVTRHIYQDLFIDCKNVTVIPIDLDNENKGLLGLKDVANQLIQLDFNSFIDLHDVFRTKLLRILFKLKYKTIFIFDKGRKEKLAILKTHQIPIEFPHTIDRYLSAFQSLKKITKICDGPWISLPVSTKLPFQLEKNKVVFKSKKWIGIAPFSKHESKEWSAQKWETLLNKLTSKMDCIYFVFAFGKHEKLKASGMIEKFPNLILIDETTTLLQQMALIQKLDVLISMDSGNMHLASLLGTKVISIWGTTHPDLGFSPLNNSAYIIQPSPEKAPWRPLSVYGKLPKSKQTLAIRTMNLVSAEEVYQMLLCVLNE